MTTPLEKVAYTAKAHAAGGRAGHGATEDGKLSLDLTPPVEMGGAGTGTNPEQLFAIGYAACFLGATKFVAKSENVTIPDDARVDAAVSIGPIPGGFGLAVELTVSLPGIDKEVAKRLAETAHNQVCPYSNATRGNIEVVLNVV
jgi:osmotically inducible protein OsmC